MDIREAREIREILRQMERYPLKDMKLQLQRLQGATAEAKQTIADLHSVAKDARATMREMRDLLTRDIRCELQAAVREHVDVLHRANKQAMEDSVTKVIDDFNRLGKLLMSVDSPNPLEEIVAAVVAKPGQGIVEKTRVQWKGSDR